MNCLVGFYLTLVIFLYIFSFRIIGPINSSILIGLLVFIWNGNSPRFRRNLRSVFYSKYFIILFRYIFFLLYLTLFFPIFYQTYDFYFSKVIIALTIQAIIGGVLWGYYLSLKEKYIDLDIEKSIVFAFVLQSLIQCIVSFTPDLQPIIFYFNEAESINESYTRLYASGVRGVALASGTGFSLSLGYGLAYIVYVKNFLKNRMSLYTVTLGVGLLVGTLFAGRTGFVGALIAAVYYLCEGGYGKLLSKFGLILKLLFYLLLFCLMVYALFTDFVNHLINNVFPFAFEPLYNLFNNDSFETPSTNRLYEMWDVPITIQEFLFGTGYYFDPVNKNLFYKSVDIGLFKNIFFWGIWGYLLIMIFQYIQLFSLRRKTNRIDKLYLLMLFLFLFLLDFKAIALGLNKTAFSIILLVNLSYETYIVYNPIRSK